MPSPALRPVLLLILTAIGALTSAPGQTAGPTSGEVTVALIQELDSKVNPTGTAQALVTKSSDPAFSKTNAAVVQVVADVAAGGFTVRLVQVGTKTQTFQVYSSTAALAPTLMNRQDMYTTHRGQAVSGPRVYLAIGMNVKFTLGAPPVAAAPPPSKTTPPAANVWQPLPIPSGSADVPAGQGASIFGNAVNGSNRGRVRLVAGCYKNSAVSTWLVVATPLVGAGLDALNEASENKTQITTLKVGDDAEQAAAFGYVDSFQNGALKFRLEVPEQFYTAAYAGKTFKISITIPNAAKTRLEANFVLPNDAAPMLAIAEPCIAYMKKAEEEMKKAEAERLAKIVVSCPVEPGKTLLDVKVRLMPGGRYLKSDPGDGSGDSWDLSGLKSGQHAVLECNYSPDSKTAKGATVGNRLTLPIPTNAVSCSSTNDGQSPVDGNCSKN